LFNKLPLRVRSLSAGLFIFYSLSFFAHADSTLSINVVDINQKPLENMVVFVEPIGHTVTLKNTQTLEVGQQNKSFIPYISVMQLGSNVKFNNQDNITHHIYSPVGDNKFSVKIRSGQQVVKNDFNKAGEVSMGCNIHDWMSGYMLIVDTPFFAKSDKSGNTEMVINKSGQYNVVVWHPQMKETNNRITKTIHITSSMELTMQLSKLMDEIPTQENEDDFDFLSDY
jgi:plastocyanin